MGQRDDRVSDDNVITEQKKPTIEARFRLWVFCVMYLAKRELNLFPLSKNQVHRTSQSEGGIPGSWISLKHGPLSKNKVHRVSQSEGGIPGSEPR